MQRIFEIDPWEVRTRQFDKKNKRLQESMTSIGNGYMGMRGFFEEDYSSDTLRGIYIGGVWFPDKTRVGWWKNGYPNYFGKVINAVNFIKTNLRLNDEPVDLAIDVIRDFSLSLDMRQAILKRSFIVAKGQAQLKVSIERFVSAAQKELFVAGYRFENVGNAAFKVSVNTQIDAAVHNEDANYGESFWMVLDKTQNRTSGELTAITKENPFGTPRFIVGNQMIHVTDLAAEEMGGLPLAVQNQFSKELEPGGCAFFEKRVIVVTSRDYADRSRLTEAMHQLSNPLKSQSLDELRAAHTQVWHNRWEKSDVTIHGDDAAQQGIRFNLFQLFSTYYGEDDRLNIGPKGFTGEKYGGATYWDTEAFALPMYLGVTDTSVTRNLLMYRYKQLNGAFINAKQQGLKGALFPMVTFNGIECHNEWEITFEEIHRNGDIAFAIYNYTRYTGDRSYVLHEGSKVLTEIARFWADRVHFSARKGRYMIHGVTGPDEYQNNVNNNWYTNYLAKWTLNYTLKILDQVSPDQAERLAVSEWERQKWREIADKMYLPEDKTLGIFVQDDDFLDKELKPVRDLPLDQLPLNQHWSWDKILRSCYIKQGDVLQGIWDFIDEFTPEQKKANFDFYEPLTVHESSLSASIHAILAADLKYEDKAVEMYERTSRLDLDNYNNDTSDGLHITSMTGSWLAIVQGFAGMRVRSEQLHFRPFLPRKWQRYQFRINFRNRIIDVAVAKEGAILTLISGEALTVFVNGRSVPLGSDPVKV